MEWSVNRFPRDLAGSGWYALLPPPAAPQILRESISADWVIIGAGFAGLSAARRLDQLVSGERIVIIDAQQVGWGAAGRNSGFMIDLPHDLQSEDYGSQHERDIQHIRVNRSAIEFSKGVVEEFGLEAFWNPNGKINAASDQAGTDALTTYGTHLQSLQEPFSTLSKGDLKSITGSDYFVSGMHTPGAVQIQPAGYIRGLAEGLKKSNRNTIEIYEQSPVTSIASNNGVVVKTEIGKVSAGKLFLTVNGHLPSFGFYQKQLMPIFTYGSMTRELTTNEIQKLGGDSEWGVVPAHPMGTTVRRLKQNRIVVRNIFTFNGSLSTSKSQIDRIGRQHDQSFRYRFPMLPNVDMEHRWGGHLCLSRNSVSVFGEIEKNIFTACCQNGLGLTKGTSNGMLIAELAVGTDHPLLADALSEPQPTTLPPEPLLSIGAKMHLWWSHRQAGRDL